MDSNDATWAWKLDTLPEETTTIVLNIYPKNISDTSTKSSTEGSAHAATQFLLEHLPKGNGLVKLLLPLQSGYIVQSDFLERRMVDCLNVTKLQGFVTPGKHIRGYTAEVYHGMSISSLLSYSYGAIVVQNDSSLSIETMSTAINDQLVSRLSFPWLSSTPIPRKRLALVGASSLTKAQGYLLAAASLNIAIVVFDEPSHWLSDNSYSHLREDFVPLDMAIDMDMAHRIAAALKRYQNSMEEKPIDGVMSFDERFHTIIAHVATQLDFKTSPPESVGLVQNKFKARQLDTNDFCRLVRSPEDLENMLSKDGPQLAYPLIIKPAKGWCSEGVWKVANEQELLEKVHLLWRESFTAWHGNEVVIETYVEGPEIDANIVLVDGEIVVFEANDDFPCTGDYNDKSGGRVQNFVETSNMLPSALPPYELQSVQQRLHELALAAGFRNAILHIEAKLRNSSCHYVKTDSDGLVDLELKTPATTTTQPKDVFLIEINPRAPGWQEVEATARTYGVCYYSISLLNALADKERIVSLSKPFLGGPQYHMQLLYVSVQKGGIYKFGDICKRVLQAPGQEHQLSAHVVKSTNLLEDGEEVLDPSTGQVYGTFIAIFLVISRTSRKEAMRIGNEIERLVREYTDGF
ncbi:hypothetical protein N7534_004651 [Penicillium rubens]|nr:hypothetical protein N7534_004651 [Penicillium rubens]